MITFTVVIPTVGRPSLSRLLHSLDSVPEVIVVDDRSPPGRSLQVPRGVRVLRTGGGEGPAAARNVGWRSATSPWVVFLDDDVELTPSWRQDLAADLARCRPTTAASQGRVSVPLPAHRPPTDRERNVAGLTGGRWITADMAYRRMVLERLGGFDERFRRAYREDSDLALRARAAGWELAQGRRRVWHPVGPAPWWSSIRDQRGNRDDVLMRRLHGRHWRERAGAGPGRATRHLLTTSFLGAVPALAAGRKGGLAAAAAAAWLASTAAFAWERIRPGPRTPGEVATMVATSAVIPAAATFWRLAGLLLDRGMARRPGPAHRVEAVLLDRDGTVVVDVPYNGDPSRVHLVPGAETAIARLRDAGLRLGLVSNQSGVGRGLLHPHQVEAVNRRVGSLVGGFDTVVYCPHLPQDGCGCRKPSPGMIIQAAGRLGVEPERCVVIGDILSDVLAAEAAGARGILVPNGETREGESQAASHVARDLADAVRLVLAWRRE